MRTVLVEPAGRFHSSLNTLLTNPPEGYKFVRHIGMYDKIVGNSFLFDKVRLNVLDRIMPLNFVRSMLSFKEAKEDIIYSYNHLSLRTKPWISQIEWPHILVGRSSRWYKDYLKEVEYHLKRSECKGVVCSSKAALDATKRIYNLPEHRCNLIYPPVIPHSREGFHTSINILFLGSINDNNRDFKLKGGPEVLEVWNNISNKYKEATLTVRARVPRRYKDVENWGRVSFIEKPFNKEELDHTLKWTDIVLFPSHLIQNTFPLEALSYGIPVVTTTTGSTFGEYIKNGQSGLVVDVSLDKYITKEGILVQETTDRFKLITEPKKEVVDKLVEYVSELIENEPLRKQLGQFGFWECNEGRFSIRERNNKLKELLDA